MSRQYIVTFVLVDEQAASEREVFVDGDQYEPCAIRQSLQIETMGPFKTKRQAQAYARHYDGYAEKTLIQELGDPKDQ